MSDAKTPREAASQAEDALEADAAVEAEVPEKLSVKANMIWNSIGSMTYLSCQWFTTIFVVRLSSGYDDAGLLSLAMSVVLFAFDLPHCQRFEPVRISLSRKKVLFFLKTSLPAVIASVAASAIFAIPKQYLALTVGSAALGIYSSVAAPALVIQMGAQYLYGPLLDIFPKLFFEGNVRGFVALLGKTVAGIVGVTVACAIVLEFIGAWALALLFGESIVPYVYLLQPIIVSTAATAFLWFFGDLLITLRHFWANFAGNVVAFLAVIPLTFLCVDRWDMNGVSFAGAGACLAGVAILLLFLVKVVKKGPDHIIGCAGEAAKDGAGDAKEAC